MNQIRAEEIIRELPKGLLNWYPFVADSCVLFVGKKEHPLCEVLEQICQVTCVDIAQIGEESGFDYVILGPSLETQSAPGVVLSLLKKVLKPEGVLLLALNNRLGIRYFCGDRDAYTGRSFDGPEGYQRAYSKEEDMFAGRMYSKAEIESMLREAGWEKFKFYSVFSDLENPALIFAEDYLPNEDLSNRIFPTYNCPDTVFLEERMLYSSLVENGMFHPMANAFLVECSETGAFCDVNHVTSSLSRGKEDALWTVILKNGEVHKKAIYPEGKEKLEKLQRNGEELKKRGIPVVEARMEKDCYVMPFMEYETGQVYLRHLLRTDQEKFLEKLDHFRDLIMQSSEVVRPESGEDLLFEKCYLDMVPLNSFVVDGEFVFFDQEFCVENYPVNVLLWRMIGSLYAGDVGLNKYISANNLAQRYGLSDRLEHWQRMEGEFLNRLLKNKELRFYHQKCRSNPEVLNSNRQRMNYSEAEYQKLFVDIFRNADAKKLILFGSGTFAKKFLELYGQDYPIYAIVDNREDKWGDELEGIKICPPDIFKDLDPGEYKVIVCIKNYLSVMKQLDMLGVRDYSIYDSGKDYPRKRKPVIVQAEAGGKIVTPKKYNVGYVAGVFDLFHIGHLNMFRRAKEYCDYLIVGVVTDERCERVKHKRPFIPFEERIEMVRSCRYVDEAVAIPENYGGTRDAWKMYHFDCQFSGSDYVNDPNWLAEKEFLEKNGAEMVFFPYTEQTSSTQIKALIEKKLL